MLLILGATGARAEPISLDTFNFNRNEDGLSLSFTAHFALSRAVDDALQKGVPLFFVAEVSVYRDRWYWSDKLVTSVRRTWRLTYQPLTRKYRVAFGGLNQTYDNLPDALTAVSSALDWKLVDAAQLDDGSHYVEFAFELDTKQMPRPMQIGIGGQAEWSLRVERSRRLN